MYSFNSKVRFSEVNADKQLGFAAIINYFQDCSAFQSEEVGSGFAFLAACNRAWIVNAWELEVLRHPVYNEKITVGTWPTEFKGAFGLRSYILQSETGETLAAANSVWIYFDTKTLRPVRILPEDSTPYQAFLKPPYPMQTEGRKIPVPNRFIEKEAIPVTPAQLDSNRHMNNGQYITMAEAVLPKDFIPRKMRAEYRKSALLGDIIHPRITITEPICTVALSNAEGLPYAVVEFKR